MKNILEIKAILEEKKESTRWIYVVTFEDGSKDMIGTSNGYLKAPYKYAVISPKARKGFKLSNKEIGIEITS
jgi:hypothetical protein